MVDSPQNATRSPEEVLTGNYAGFLQLLDEAADALTSGTLEDATGQLQHAANLAWKHKTGLFSCAHLEEKLGQIAKAAGLDQRLSPEGHPVEKKQRRVLHVFTETYPIGGHSRLAQRWIALDTVSRHDAVATWQNSVKAPDFLLDAVRQSGGTYHDIDEPGMGLLERARALRGISRGTDFIVVHQHPDDVVPTLAYSIDNDVPVIYMNHADHSFWVGASIANVIAHFRNSGIQLTRERRGIDDTRIYVLPIPIDRVEDTIERKEAKQKLGLAAESFLVVSIGAEWKYTTFNNFDYLDMVEPFVHEHGDAFVLAVGAREQGPWVEANQRTGGRIKAPGTIRNLDIVYRAADVLLSPIPLGSVTAMLEGASYGLPLVSFCPQDVQASVLFNDDMIIPDSLHHVTDAAELRERLARLKRDEAYRKRAGKTARELCEQAHVGENWRGFLEKVYTAAQSTPAKPPSAQAAVPKITELDRMLLNCSG